MAANRSGEENNRFYVRLPGPVRIRRRNHLLLQRERYRTAAVRRSLRFVAATVAMASCSGSGTASTTPSESSNTASSTTPPTVEESPTSAPSTTNETPATALPPVVLHGEGPLCVGHSMSARPVTVTGVAADDVLNFRFAPDPSSALVATAVNGTLFFALGETKVSPDGGIWELVEVPLVPGQVWEEEQQNGCAWVNTRYVAEGDGGNRPGDSSGFVPVTELSGDPCTTITELLWEIAAFETAPAAASSFPTSDVYYEIAEVWAVDLDRPAFVGAVEEDADEFIDDRVVVVGSPGRVIERGEVAGDAYRDMSGYAAVEVGKLEIECDLIDFRDLDDSDVSELLGE